MVDRVKPLKLESPDSGGVETDEFPTSLNVAEDFVDARGLTIQNDTSNDDTVRVSRDASNNLTFQDGVAVGVKTLSDLLGGGGLTPEAHRILDQLVHDLDESHYQEVAYAGSKVSNITVWDSVGKTTKIREYDYTYSGTLITGEVIKQYDAVGTLLETLTYAYTYSGGRIASATCTRT